VFYFSPGDQAYPIYHHSDIKRVLANAVLWANPERGSDFAPPAGRRHARTPPSTEVPFRKASRHEPQ
jgi:trehalose utilization protein